jgi:anti-sigma factor RsiW
MKCDEYEEQVSALIDNELADQESEQLFAHLGECAMCRATVRSTLELRANLKEDVPLLAPKELDARLLTALPSRRQVEPDRVAIPGKIWQHTISMRIPVAMVATLVLILGSFILSSMWFESKQATSVRTIQTVYLTAVPTVEVRAYTMKPMTTIQ